MPAFEDLQAVGKVRCPIIPDGCEHNAHMYYLRLEDYKARDQLLDVLRKSDIGAAFHYIPLHSSPAGMRFGRVAGELPVTDEVASTLLRLPIYPSLGAQIDRVIDLVHEYFGDH